MLLYIYKINLRGFLDFFFFDINIKVLLKLYVWMIKIIFFKEIGKEK